MRQLHDFKELFLSKVDDTNTDISIYLDKYNENPESDGYYVMSLHMTIYKLDYDTYFLNNIKFIDECGSSTSVFQNHTERVTYNVSTNTVYGNLYLHEKYDTDIELTFKHVLDLMFKSYPNFGEI